MGDHLEADLIVERLGSGVIHRAPAEWDRQFGLRQYTQYDRVAVDLARVAVLHLIEQEYPRLRGWIESGAWCTPEGEHDIHLALVVSPLRHAWGLLRRIDSDGRRWWSIEERLVAEYLSGTVLSDRLMEKVHVRAERIKQHSGI